MRSDLFAFVDRLGRLSVSTRICVPRPKSQTRRCKSFIRLLHRNQACRAQVTRLYTIRDLDTRDARSLISHLPNTASIPHPHTIHCFILEVERQSYSPPRRLPYIIPPHPRPLHFFPVFRSWCRAETVTLKQHDREYVQIRVYLALLSKMILIPEIESYDIAPWGYHPPPSSQIKF